MTVDVSGVAASVPTLPVGPAVGNGQAARAVTAADKGDGAMAAKDSLGGKESPAHKSEPAKPAHGGEPVQGFNPSIRIDSDTHMVVMTVRDPEGKVLRQIPNEHELAAYKTEAVQQSKKQAGTA